MQASAVQVSVGLDQNIRCVDILLESVILKNNVLASQLTVQKIYTFRMDLHVAIIRPTAT